MSTHAVNDLQSALERNEIPEQYRVQLAEVLEGIDQAQLALSANEVRLAAYEKQLRLRDLQVGGIMLLLKGG